MNPLKYVDIGHETIAYREAGNGKKPLVLIHGNMTSSVHYNLLMDKLKDTHQMYAVDLRGFGGSSYNNTFDDLQTLTDDVIHWMKAIGLENADVLGWSTGGGIAMLMAAKYPSYVNHLYLMESVGIYGYPVYKKDSNFQAIIGDLYLDKASLANDPIQVKPVLEAIEKKDKAFYKGLWNQVIYNVGNYPDDTLYETYLDDMLTQKNLVDIDFSLMRFNMSPVHNGMTMGDGSVKDIRCKTTIIQGENDLVVPMAMCQTIIDNIAHADVHILANSGHNPMIDQLERVVSIIRGD